METFNFTQDLEKFKTFIEKLPKSNDEIKFFKNIVDHIDNIILNVGCIKSYANDKLEINTICRNIALSLGIIAGTLEINSSLSEKLFDITHTDDSSISREALIELLENSSKELYEYATFLMPNDKYFILFEMKSQIYKIEILSEFLSQIDFKEDDYCKISWRIQSIVSQCKEILNNYNCDEYFKVIDIFFGIGEITGMLNAKNILLFILANELDTIFKLLSKL